MQLPPKKQQKPPLLFKSGGFCCWKETSTIAPNNRAIVIHLPSRLSWDKRAWFLGLFLGNFAGLLLLCGSNMVFRLFFETAFPYTVFGYYTGDLLIFLGLVFGALIFPAVLPCLAKRFYALWGLLPIVLLLLWIVAGSMIADTVPSMFDPVWALPLVAFLCWVVACYPVSLFRFLREHRRQTAALTLSPTPKRSSPQWAYSLALLIPLLAVVILGWYNLKHPPHFSVNVHAHWASGKEARVPLIKHGSKLFVKAWLNGQEELCRIDTGASSVGWPRELHIQGRLTSQRGQSRDPLGGSVHTQTIVLPHIRIGSYEIDNLPTEMSDTDSSLFSPPQRSYANEEPNLGNPVFVMSVLTIDYKNAVLVIRPPQYDFTRQHRRSGDRMLEMGWTTDYSDKDWESNLYGWPAVRVALAGASFWCTLDTGWAGPELGLTDDLVKHNPSFKQAKHDLSQFNAAHSSAQVERLHDLNVRLPCLWPPHANPISLTTDGFVTPTLYGGEGVIGLALMERYRITIDYGRGRVLLELYAQDGRGQKQEKTLPKPKQTAI